MIFNLTAQQCISQNPFFARSIWERMRGLIGYDFEKSYFDAMVFERCNMIHSCFMSMSIDVIFVNRSNIICGLEKSLRPWRPLVRCKDAYFTLELPVGAISQSKTSIGDIIDLQAELSNAASEKKHNDNFMGAVNTAIPFAGKENKNENILS